MIGNLSDRFPQEWPWTTLLRACIDIIDCPHSTPEIVAGGSYLMARTPDIFAGVFRVDEARRVSRETFLERTRRAEPRHGDLLFSREGTYFGIAAEIPSNTKICLGQRMVLLRPDIERTDPRFLRYWLNSPLIQSHIHGYRDGSVAERLNLPTIRALPVCLPPLPEQRRIAAILGALDDKIELNRKMNRTLETMARTIFKSWFIDFDGHTDLVDSELGPIPKGWKVGEVNDLGSVVTGKTPATTDPENFGDQYPFIKIPDMHGKVWLDSTVSSLSEIGHRRQPKKLVPPSAIAVSCIATPGLVGLIRRPSHTNQQINTVIPGPDVSSAWAFFALRGLAQLLIARAAGGSVTRNLNKGQFCKLPILIPTKTEMEHFASVVHAHLQRIASNEEQSRTLAALRDTLLPKLISGEIRVPEAERAVEEVVA